MQTGNRNRGRTLLWICLLAPLCGCNAQWRLGYSFLWILSPGGAYEEVGTRPDYSLMESWAAHPAKPDGADFTPNGPFADRQAGAAADAFYIHPTTYISRKNWNQPDPLAKDDLLDRTLLPNQASVFNGCCRVFAPRYRQATFYSFADRKGRGEAALELAYQDVLAAFDAFLTESGPERPIVLAAHSQGSAHLQRLVAERFREAALRRRLVVAYAPGYPLPKDLFAEGASIPFCTMDNDTSCLASWNAVEQDHYMPRFFKDVPVYENGAYSRLNGRAPACANPASWGRRAGMQQLGYLGGFFQIDEQGPALSPAIRSAGCHEGWLIIKKPSDQRFRQVMMSGGWYHVYEYALFWKSLRNNVSTRLKSYQEKYGVTQ